MTCNQQARAHARAAPLLVLLALNGCMLAPPGFKDEQAKMETAGEPFEAPLEERQLPELPARPTWRDVLQRSFLANGELEAAYFEWRASLARVEAASGWPNSNVSLDFNYMFSGENMKAFDRVTVVAGFDAIENLSWPGKTEQAAKVALAQAKASGERFAATKFQIQREVLSTWTQFVLTAEKLRLAKRNWTLLKIDRGAAEGRVAAGATQEDMLKAELAAARQEDLVRTLESELASLGARLNAMMARPIDAPLMPPNEIPPSREMTTTDDVLLVAGARKNPELAALAHQVQGRADALELARMQWIPDINPYVGLTGTASQMIGAAVSLPTTIVEIRAGIKEAESMQREAQAMLRQQVSHHGGEFVATLAALRNAERRMALFRHDMLPAGEHLAANAEQCCIAGTTPLSDLLMARQIVFEIREQVAEAWAEREMRLAELEALAGIDIETLEPAHEVDEEATHDEV